MNTQLPAPPPMTGGTAMPLTGGDSRHSPDETVAEICDRRAEALVEVVAGHLQRNRPRRALCQANVGYLDVKPVLFPVALCGDTVAAAMTVLASTAALIIDVTGCIGRDPAMQAFVCSYLFGPESVQLTGLLERGRLTRSWTLPYVPGRRFGLTKSVCVLTSGTTFSGGEHLAYDLQQLCRATIVGERTGGGAHAREGFPVHPHLEATIPVARGVSPITGTNWEGTGVEPDIHIPVDQAPNHSLTLAHEHLEASAGINSGAAG
ncbi:MAG: S41 family peptidase [Actinomycetota bacterium]|nr:S41 family peptidase [Actinomycetota bacterium]